MFCPREKWDESKKDVASASKGRIGVLPFFGSAPFSARGKHRKSLLAPPDNPTETLVTQASAWDTRAKTQRGGDDVDSLRRRQSKPPGIV